LTSKAKLSFPPIKKPRKSHWRKWWGWEWDLCKLFIAWGITVELRKRGVRQKPLPEDILGLWKNRSFRSGYTAQRPPPPRLKPYGKTVPLPPSKKRCHVK